MTKDPPATLDEPDTDCEVIEKLRAEIERLRAALATVRIFIDGEMIAHAVVVPEGARVDDLNNPSLLQLIDAALGVEQEASKT